jgi:hypothetical protein
MALSRFRNAPGWASNGTTRRSLVIGTERPAFIVSADGRAPEAPQGDTIGAIRRHDAGNGDVLDSAHSQTTALNMSPNRPLLVLGRSALAAVVLAIGGGPATAQLLKRQIVPLQSEQELTPKPAPAIVPKAVLPAPKTAPGRAAFATRLSASFLAGGYSLRVLSQETATGGEQPQRFPKLLIAGAFDEAFVFKMVSTWRFLEPAMKSGFRSADILSMLGQRHYIYDLSAGPPRCDIAGRVCH